MSLALASREGSWLAVTVARALLQLLEALAAGRAVDPQASHQMIAVLEQQTVNERIPAGLPPGTPVAHKTGEITRIRHDAAIVYAPRPFVLVVLTRGLTDEKAADERGTKVVWQGGRLVASMSATATPAI